MNNELKVECDGISIEGRKIIRPFHFALTQPGTTALIGKNGSGKSTLLRYTAGLRESRSFTLRIGSKWIGELNYKEKSKIFSWLPQRFEYSSEYTVFDLLMLGRFRFHRGFPAAVDRQKCEEYLQAFGLTGLAAKKLYEISGGELQRAALARAFVGESDILILDEPFSGLDIDSAMQVYDLFLSMNSKGHRILYSVHGLDLLSLHRGAVLAIDQDQSLKSFPSFSDIERLDFNAIYGVDIKIGSHQDGSSFFELRR